MGLGIREVSTYIPVTEFEKCVSIDDVGRPGKDAYVLWLEAGHVGTLEDFFHEKMTFTFPDETDPETTLTLFVGNERWRFVEAQKNGASAMLFQKKVDGVWQNTQTLDYIAI